MNGKKDRITEIKERECERERGRRRQISIQLKSDSLLMW